MAEKQKRVVITTPAGEIKFSHIHKPNMKFAKNGIGEFQIDVLIDPDAPGMPELMANIQKTAEATFANGKKEALAKAKNPKEKAAINEWKLYVPFSEDYDKDGAPTGKILLKAKNAAEGKKKNGETFQRRIAVFDAKGKPITTPIKIGRGSTVKVAVSPNPFIAPGVKNAGVSLWFEAVQVINLVEWAGGQDASQYGFGQEDGYEASDDDNGGQFQDESNSGVTHTEDDAQPTDGGQF